ncbi:MAG TPA: helix-turn-helix domain-containing protein [Chitinophaga sp.]|uniref:helix-turn-helix domain-containing protein n=1 Tax=Chitinophaga sp. TaxID=1869181 RepID=UPI002D151F4C|nr:helix-turn-helix domain-containing protein [Chitinophaga sp.]HVI46381.1 helix-turn-helix domain-containing protein [Chitinophaga sp.]
MKSDTETIRQYYEITGRKLPADLQLDDNPIRHFNVMRRNNCYVLLPFVRRDYYKICIGTGQAVLYTEKGEVKIDKPAIFFSNPLVKFGWRNLSGNQQGYVCLFNELYISADLKRELKKLAKLFEHEVYPFLTLTDKQYELLVNYFRIMAEEYCGEFEYKQAMIGSILRLIIYTAMKFRMDAHPELLQEKQGQLVTRFFDLLDGQFPVDSPRNPIKMTTPAHFADYLHIHVNHLNHTVKQHTGKTTSHFIQEKRLSEALALLENTDWTIAEIGNSLGFEYPQYFNVFFKKQTGKSPRFYRDGGDI